MNRAKPATNQAVRAFLRFCSGVISRVVMVTLLNKDYAVSSCAGFAAAKRL